jgi:hypothetical protein
VASGWANVAFGVAVALGFRRLGSRSTTDGRPDVEFKPERLLGGEACAGLHDGSLEVVLVIKAVASQRLLGAAWTRSIEMAPLIPKVRILAGGVMTPRSWKPRNCQRLRRPRASVYGEPHQAGSVGSAPPKASGADPERRASGPALLGGASGVRSGPP